MAGEDNERDLLKQKYSIILIAAQDKAAEITG